ncbi:MAG: hypothetical protein ABSA05_16265, partial [Opitutaceae bacterium]
GSGWFSLGSDGYISWSSEKCENLEAGCPGQASVETPRRRRLQEARIQDAKGNSWLAGRGID